MTDLLACEHDDDPIAQDHARDYAVAYLCGGLATALRLLLADPGHRESAERWLATYEDFFRRGE